MKSKIRCWTPEIRSPWLTRSEAADYLRWNIRTIDRHLVAMAKGKVQGKMRYELQHTGGSIKMVRILAEDVYAICPLPPGYEDESQMVWANSASPSNLVGGDMRQEPRSPTG